MVKNLTVGNPLKLVFSFAVPLVLGNFFQQLYNLVDTIIVGRLLGLNALTAVGSTSSIMFLISGFYIGTCAGMTIPVATQFGAGDYRRMREYVANSAYLGIGLAVLMTSATMLLCNNILNWMSTPADIYQGAYIYLMVIFVGIPFNFLYNISAGIIRAMGDSKTPFIFMLVATGLNAILDLVCIAVFKMGVDGAALATVIAQGVGSISCFMYMKKRYDILKMSQDERRLRVPHILKMLAMGLPMGLQYSITAIGSTMLQTAVNKLSSECVSAFAAACKLKLLGICPYEAIGTAVATFSSQNLGAGKIKRIKQGALSGFLIGAIYSLFIAVIFRCFGTNLALLFVDSSETTVLALVQQFLSITVLFYTVLDTLVVFRMAVQGMGHPAISMISGVSELFARGLMATFVISRVGWIGVCFTDQTAWASGAIVCVFLFIVFYRRLRKTIPDTEEVVLN